MSGTGTRPGKTKSPDLEHRQQFVHLPGPAMRSGVLKMSPRSRTTQSGQKAEGVGESLMRAYSTGLTKIMPFPDRAGQYSVCNSFRRHDRRGSYTGDRRYPDYDNTSALFDEILAHRIGLIPIRNRPVQLMSGEVCSCNGEGVRHAGPRLP